MSVEAGRIASPVEGALVRRVRLPNDRRTPAAARALVRSVLEEAGLDSLLNEALLLTTELSTNAPETTVPGETIELTACPIRPCQPCTNFAGGHGPWWV